MDKSSSNESALLGVALAGTIAVLIEDGPFSYLSITIGASLLVVLHAYHDNTDDSFIKQLAFGTIWSLCFLLVVGILIQLIEDKNGLNLFITWCLSTIIITTWRRFGIKRNGTKNE